MKLAEAQAMWLQQSIPFVSFRMPGKAGIRTLAGGAFTTELPETDGPYFVFAPFDREQTTRLYLSPQIDFQDDSVPAVEPMLLPSDLVPRSGSSCVEVDREAYLQQANQLIAALKAGQLQKVVLSRIICKPLKKSDLPEMFGALCALHPQAFVYLLSDGGQQCWLGASPELLLSWEHGAGETMSLAGTQKIDGQDPATLLWGDKEREEQQLVTDFIFETLSAQAVDQLGVSGPETHVAGQLAHLKTRFGWKGSFSQAAGLAEHLHPTPAVCGLPRDAAHQIIRETESHQRSYYTGYLGLAEAGKQAHFFVNLRCLQLEGDMACLYVGGGLTALSVAEREWEETEAKSRTLLHVFPK